MIVDDVLLLLRVQRRVRLATARQRGVTAIVLGPREFGALNRIGRKAKEANGDDLDADATLTSFEGIPIRLGAHGIRLEDEWTNVKEAWK